MSRLGSSPSAGASGDRELVGVVLAAGKGTRMRSSLPKVLQPVAGRPMVSWVLSAVRAVGCHRVLVVIGHDAQRVRGAIAGDDITWVLQSEQRGTGDAVARVVDHLATPARLLVVSGDVPLVTAATLERLARSWETAWAAMAVARLARPGSLGRVLAAADGTLAGIVEAADATPEQLQIDLINAGLYCLPAPEIFDYLARLRPDNTKGELYLTDALTDAAERGETVKLVELESAVEALGVNDRDELAQVDRLLRARMAPQLMES